MRIWWAIVIILPLTWPLQAAVHLTPVFSQHPWTQLVYMAPVPDRSDSFFVLEKEGYLSMVNKVAKNVLLDLSAKITDVNEQGLLGLALDPKFLSDDRRYIYLYYSIENPKRSVIARIKVAKDYRKLSPKNLEKLLVFAQPYSNHNGGMLEFGPEGYLYIGTGDGGSAGDPHNHAQNLNSLLGKILRIDVASGNSYKIPPTNPFYGKAQHRGEIFAYGLRNPWRFSFLPQSHSLIIGDVGQDKEEEISIADKGDNLGWNIFEGFSEYRGAGKDPIRHRPPILTMGRSQAASITGGYVYQGDRVPSLKNKYIFGDFVFGTIWAVDLNKTPKTAEVIGQKSSVVSFAKGHQGELYVLEFTGAIYAIQGK